MGKLIEKKTEEQKLRAKNKELREKIGDLKHTLDYRVREKDRIAIAVQEATDSLRNSFNHQKDKTRNAENEIILLKTKLSDSEKRTDQSITALITLIEKMPNMD